MYVLYVLLYPFVSLLLAGLAVHFFPFTKPESREPLAQPLFAIYQAVDYFLALFALLFCLLLLRRIAKRSLAFLTQLPLPFSNWHRLKHLIPLTLCVAILLYLFRHLFGHTVIGVLVLVVVEVFSYHHSFSKRRRYVFDKRRE